MATSNNEPEASEREIALAALAQHLLQAAEREKAALAHKLHGELGSFLTVASLDVAAVAHKLKQSEPELAARLARVLDKIRQAADFKREVVESLRPSMLDGLGLSACLQQHALEFGRRTGWQVTSDIRSDCDGLAPDAATAVFRIAQQTLGHVPQGAQAGELRISLREHNAGAALLLDVGGIDLHLDDLALSAMRQRAAAQGGKLMVARREGVGVVVECWIPLPR